MTDREKWERTVSDAQNATCILNGYQSERMKSILYADRRLKALEKVREALSTSMLIIREGIPDVHIKSCRCWMCLAHIELDKLDAALDTLAEWEKK